MSRDDEVLQSIQSVHDAVLQPDGWDQATAPVAGETPSVGPARGREDFGGEDVAALPHLASALKASMKLAEASLQARAASHAFDAMNVAVVLVDARARIIFANGRAEIFLSRDNGLTTDGVHIGGADTPPQRGLRRAIAQCAGSVFPRAAVAPVEIAAADGSASLRVTFAPLGRNTIDLHHPHLGLAEPAALLLIHDHAQQRKRCASGSVGVTA